MGMFGSKSAVIERPAESEAELGRNKKLLEQLCHIVGRRYVLTGSDALLRYTVGYRTGSGDAVAAVLPGSLFQLWQIALVCMRADKILIMQAANTGLTGGSTPFGDYDRDVVVVNTLRLRRSPHIEWQASRLSAGCYVV